MLQKFGKLHRKQAAWDVNAEIKFLILALSLFLERKALGKEQFANAN
jgi:hypothetical protein